MKQGPEARKWTTQSYSAAYNTNSFRVPDVHVVCCVRTIVLSYISCAGHNSVVCELKHSLFPADDEVIARIPQNKRA